MDYMGDGVFAVILVLFGSVSLLLAVLQWKGLETTENIPYFFLGRAYLMLVPGGLGCIAAAAAIFTGWLGWETLAIALVGVAGLLLLSGVGLLSFLPSNRLRPEWQRQQMEWWEAEEAAGRRVRWAERPDHLRYGPGVIKGWVDYHIWRIRPGHLDLDQATDILHNHAATQAKAEDTTDPPDDHDPQHRPPRRRA